MENEETTHSQRYSGPNRRTASPYEKMVVEIHEALLGTMEKEGLVSTVRRHEIALCELKDVEVLPKIKERDGFVQGWHKLKWVLVTAIVVSTVGCIFAIVNTFVKVQVSPATAQCTTNIGVSK